MLDQQVGLQKIFFDRKINGGQITMGNAQLQMFVEKKLDYLIIIMTVVQKLKHLDHKISEIIHQLDHFVPTYVLYPFTAFFHPGLIWLPYLSILYLSNYDLGFTLLYVLATLCCLIFTTVLKKLVKRPRPTLNPKVSKPHHFRKKQKNNSMPSGDAFQSAAYVTFLFSMGVNPLFLVVFHICVCIGRVYYMCHWLADTMVSSVMGAVIAQFLLNSGLSQFLATIPEAIL